MASHPQIRGETALSRLQQRVSQGDVKSLVVQPEEQIEVCQGLDVDRK